MVAGQPFQIQFTVEGASVIENWVLPDLSKFTVYDSYDSKSTTIQNPGLKVIEMTSKIILVSRAKAGTVVVPAAIAVVNGKKMKSNSLLLKIEKQSPYQVPTFGNQSVEEVSELKPNEDISKKIGENLFVRASVNKQVCFVGEALMITHRLFSRMNTNSEVQKRPSLTGFSVIEMVDEYKGEPETEFVQGLAFNTYLVRKVQAFALQPGNFIVEPAEVLSTVHLVKQDEALKWNPIDETVVTKSNELEVEVMPLPAGQPENFSGAVGKFELNMRASQPTVLPGDMVKIILTISGTGNIPLLIPPEIQWPKQVDTADPIVREEYNKYVFPLEGQKTFEYSFTAPDTGEYIIPAVKLSYFDPASKKYQSVRSDSVIINVKAGAVNPRIESPVTTAPPTNSNRQMFWFAIVVVAIVSWIAYQMIDWKQSGKKAKKKVEKKELIPIAPKNPFEKAREELGNGNYVSFYREVEQVIWKKIGESTNILPSVLNKQNVSQVLRKKAVGEKTISELMELLRECEWALYVPDHENKNAEGFIARTEAILSAI